MTRIDVDGQWPIPKPAPSAPVNLIDPDLQLAGLPLVKEGLSKSEWDRLDGWIETERMDLGDLASTSLVTSDTRCNSEQT